MLRSLFSGVSGMRTHQLDMDVIANNISNVNTTGFKASRFTFKEVYSQLLRPGRGPLGNRGGVNPQQVGLGVTPASMDTIFIQGPPQATGRDTDVCINGGGFFVVTNGQDRFFTRAGNFSVDSGGYLVYSNGMQVMGWNADRASFRIDTARSAEAIQLPVQLTIPGQATSLVEVVGNLDAETSVGDSLVLTMDVVDSRSYSHSLQVTLTRLDPGTWELSAAALDSDPMDIEGGALPPPTLVFDAQGQPLNPVTYELSLAPMPNGAADMSIDFDWSGLTMLAQKTDAKLEFQDGYKAGTLTSYAVDDAGVIKGVFSNGQMRDLAQVAVAAFANPEGLTKQFDTLFSESDNSGQAAIGQAGVGGRGPLMPGFLEMSNVDLSQEFANLILAQRGFQANSRVITTSDEMLQELMTLKR